MIFQPQKKSSWEQFKRNLRLTAGLSQGPGSVFPLIPCSIAHINETVRELARNSKIKSLDPSCWSFWCLLMCLCLKQCHFRFSHKLCFYYRAGLNSVEKPTTSIRAIALASFFGWENACEHLHDRPIFTEGKVVAEGSLIKTDLYACRTKNWIASMIVKELRRITRVVIFG